MHGDISNNYSFALKRFRAESLLDSTTLMCSLKPREAHADLPDVPLFTGVNDEQRNA